MNLQTQIRQQQSTVQMLQKLLKAKRCRQSDVDQAQARLTDLEQQQHFKPLSQSAPALPPASTPLPAARPQIEGNDYLAMQADLSKEVDRLNRKMAELSNSLHQVPQTANCPELTKPILEYKAQIEAIWDKKRYLERNRFLPEEAVEPEQEDLPTVENEDKFKLTYRKRRLIDLISKNKKKLENPKAKPGKRLEWETDIAKARLEIQEIELKLV